MGQSLRNPVDPPVSRVVIVVLIGIDQLIWTSPVSQKTQIGQIGKEDLHFVDKDVQVLNLSFLKQKI